MKKQEIEQLLEKFHIKREVSFETKLMRKQIKLLKLALATFGITILLIIATILILIGFMTQVEAQTIESPTNSLAIAQTAPQAPLKKNTGEGLVQDIIRYAWEISPDPDFIATLEAESGFNPEAISPPNWDGSRDFLLCQLNSRYHWSFIKTNPDWKSQVHYCASVYANASSRGILHRTFYGWNKREQMKERFIWTQQTS